MPLRKVRIPGGIFLCGLVDFIQLSGIKLVIVAFFCHEFFVGSSLQDAAVVNVHDPVTVTSLQKTDLLTGCPADIPASR